MDTISLGIATRRRFLTRFGVLAGAGLALPLLQACGGGAPTTTAPAAAPTTAAAAPTAAAAAPTAAAAAAATAAPKPAAAAAASPAAAPTAAAQAAPATVASPTTAGAASGQVVGQINVADVKKYSGQTIHLAVQKHTATDAIQQMSPSFESQTGIKVNFENIPQQQLNQKQLTDLSTGTGSYDVIGWFMNPEYVENNWIYPVDELQQDKNITDTKLLAMDDFFPKFLEYYRYHDKLWGLPFYGESLMMYYNTDEFQKVGIDKAPNTVDDLEDVCKKIKAAGRMSGLALRGSAENADIYPFLAWVYGYGGFWVDQTSNEIGLDRPETIAAGDAWGHFMREYAPPDVANYFWNEVQLAMQQEKAAIIMDATNFGPRLEDPAQSKITGKVGFAQLPEKLGPDGKPARASPDKGALRVQRCRLCAERAALVQAEGGRLALLPVGHQPGRHAADNPAGAARRPDAPFVAGEPEVCREVQLRHGREHLRQDPGGCLRPGHAELLPAPDHGDRAARYAGTRSRPDPDRSALRQGRLRRGPAEERRHPEESRPAQVRPAVPPAVPAAVRLDGRGARGE